TANSSATDYNRTPRTGSFNAYLRYSNEDWMFIPIQLTGGVSYDFSCYARQDGGTATNASIAVSFGTDKTAAAMTNTIVASTGLVNGNYQHIEGQFTPASSGIYFIGIKGQINGTPWYISLDDISIVTSPTDTPDYVGLQFPASATILAGESATVYGQVYEAGLTDVEPGLSGQASGIQAWVGVSTTNTDPSTWASNAWTVATWNGGHFSNNDEYQANIEAHSPLVHTTMQCASASTVVLTVTEVPTVLTATSGMAPPIIMVC
ncbi:MAG TPA: hypothetical protein PLA69_06365, partial [Flavobacterium sp.]|nr:hypothetical protein [Flavobacterium sp.]